MIGPPAPSRYEAAFFVGRVETGSTWGVVADISITGMRIKTEQIESVGSRHTLLFIWGDEEYRVGVEVVRHTDDGLAVRFLEEDQDRDAAIREITAGSPKREGRLPNYDE